MNAQNIIKFPCPTERRIKELNTIRDRVLNGGQTAEQLAADCKVLLASDLIAHQRVARFMMAYRLPVLTGEAGPTRRLTGAELVAGGAHVRLDPYADFTEAAADSAADLRKLFAPCALAILAAVAIGVACEWMWGAV